MKTVYATLCSLVLAGFATANVTVNGQGKVTYTPDVYYITVGVSSDAATADEAWKKNGEIVRKLFEVLKGYNIDARDMQTSGLNIQPRYVHKKDEEPRVVGYTASYDLKVTVRRMEDLGVILDSLVDNGANRRMNITFGYSNPEKLLDEARVQAVADARKKAHLYVTGAGASLGQVVSISENSHFAPRSLMYEHVAPAKADGLPIAVGEQEMSVTVTVVFGINHNLSKTS